MNIVEKNLSFKIITRYSVSINSFSKLLRRREHLYEYDALIGAFSKGDLISFSI